MIEFGQRTIYLTYTCPVSRFTYAGHPRSGHLYEHTNDLKDAVSRIKRIAVKHGQPVSWVINDQEYLNKEGLLPDFLLWQSQGDSILVTMELTTSPSGIDKFDTKQVIRWIGEQCDDANLKPDGLWSLKFFESDLKALAEMPVTEYPWTRNLAGSCWHQMGIDDSTWLGCPFNPYYPALWNIKAPAQPDEPQEFLMLEWLTRDIQACLSGGFPATFSLDPADTNRKAAGGFGCEEDALRYSRLLINETVRQAAFNPIVVVDINEEARHYQSEGHDKDFMLEGMFGEYAKIARGAPAGATVRQAAYREVWDGWRQQHPHMPESIYLYSDLDWRTTEIPGAGAEYNYRTPGDKAVLYQDADVQIGFLKSRGPLPVEFYSYAMRIPGLNSNDPYPSIKLPPIDLREQHIEQEPDGLKLTLLFHSSEAVDDAGFFFWDIPVKGDETVVEKDPTVKNVRVTPAGLFVLAKLNKGPTHSIIHLRNS